MGHLIIRTILVVAISAGSLFQAGDFVLCIVDNDHVAIEPAVEGHCAHIDRGAGSSADNFESSPQPSGHTDIFIDIIRADYIRPLSSNSNSPHLSDTIGFTFVTPSVMLYVTAIRDIPSIHSMHDPTYGGLRTTVLLA